MERRSTMVNAVTTMALEMEAKQTINVDSEVERE